MFLDPGTKFMEVCNNHLLSFVSCVWWCKRVYQTTFYLYLIQFRSFKARWGQVYIYIFVRVCVFICLVLGFSFFYAVLLFTFCSAGHDSTQTRKCLHSSSFFLLYDRSLSLFACSFSYDTFVLRSGRGDRKMNDRDISARNYCSCHNSPVYRLA